MNTFAAAMLVALSIKVAMAASALTQPTDPPPRATRIVAVGTIEPDVDLAVGARDPADEVRETVKLYLAGKIDQWFSRADRSDLASCSL